jgi:glycosyltransferase involved in cell wall biosynthesis
LIRLVPAFGYARNISLARAWNEVLFARRVYMRARREPAPELIVFADPPPVIGRMAVWLARRSKCPLIVDVMDLWPELFALALPKRLRSWAPLIFSPFYAMRKGNHAQVDGLVALSESYRAKMIAQVPNGDGVPSATIFNGIDVDSFRSTMREQSEAIALPPKSENSVRAVYAGSLGENYDVITLMKAAMILEERAVPIQIVIAGVGPLLAQLTDFIRDRQLKNLIYVGRLSPEQLPGLYSQCEIGISAYGAVSTVAMPDKAYDYMAAGLPIVNSLQGELAELIEARQIGLSYSAGDPESLASALQKLTSDEKLRTDMSRRSFAAGDEFDRSAQYSAFPDLLKRACQHYAETHSSNCSRALEGSSRI